MNILLWVLQILLALHTVMGAVWKFSKTAAQSAPSLKAIPNPVWLAMSVFELLCAAALVVPLIASSLGSWAPIAALAIAGEMLVLTAVHLASGYKKHGQMIYWLVVAVFCAFIAYGRFVLRPL